MLSSTSRAEFDRKAVWPDTVRETALQLHDVPGDLACVSEQMVKILGEVLGATLAGYGS